MPLAAVNEVNKQAFNRKSPKEPKPVYQLTSRQVLDSFDTITPTQKEAVFDAYFLSSIVKHHKKDVYFSAGNDVRIKLAASLDVGKLINELDGKKITAQDAEKAQSLLNEKLKFLEQNPIKPSPFVKELSPKSKEFNDAYLDEMGLTLKDTSPAAKRRIASRYNRDKKHHAYIFLKALSEIDTPKTSDNVFSDYFDKLTLSQKPVFPKDDFEALGDRLLPEIKQKGQAVIDKVSSMKLSEALDKDVYRSLINRSELGINENTKFSDVINKDYADDKYSEFPLSYSDVVYGYIKQLNAEIDSNVKRGGVINVAAGEDIDAKLKGGLKDALRFIPTDWIEQSNNIGAIYATKSKDENPDKKDRAFMGFATITGRYTTNEYYCMGGDSILGAPSPTNSDYSETLYHELIHRIQSVMPEIDAVFQAEHRRRTKDLAKNRILGGRDDEFGIEDDYPKHYYGREYVGAKEYHLGALEVMPMSLSVLVKGLLNKSDKRVYIGGEAVSFVTDDLLAVSLGVLTEFKAV